METTVVNEFDHNGERVVIYKHTSPDLTTYGYKVSGCILGAGMDTQEQAERLAKAVVDSL